MLGHGLGPGGQLTVLPGVPSSHIAHGIKLGISTRSTGRRIHPKLQHGHFTRNVLSATDGLQHRASPLLNGLAFVASVYVLGL